MKKLIYGFGINDADYVVQIKYDVERVSGQRKQKTTWVCPFYRRWFTMLSRSYSAKVQSDQPTYEGCSVCEEWHLFSNFKAWMEKQDWEGKHLDKDLLVIGNKVYSPKTCVFVSGVVNTFVIDCGSARGSLPIGVYWHKRDEKFVAQCSNPFTKKREFLGYFVCEIEAHKTWLTRKLELAQELAATQSDGRVAKALVNMYTNYPIIGGRHD